jgi:hypothetical protein
VTLAGAGHGAEGTKTDALRMHGLMVLHHIVDDRPADALRNGLSLLGAAVIGRYPLPATQPQEAQP